MNTADLIEILSVKYKLQTQLHIQKARYKYKSEAAVNTNKPHSISQKLHIYYIETDRQSLSTVTTIRNCTCILENVFVICIKVCAVTAYNKPYTKRDP